MKERAGYLIARDLDELSHAFQLVPRSKSCVKCDDATQLECPKCADNEVCQFTVPLDCTMCATSICEKDSSSSVDSGSKGPNVGAIVGGVLGGIAVIAIATYVVWRFCIKPKRSHVPTSIYVEDTDAIHNEKDAGPRGIRPPSTHTVHSIASTVLTRASNIIQIAYIPGVTNRATPTSPNVLVPPVPPIPMHHAEANRSLGNDDQHFFVPGDLRDSTYSGLSGYSDRTSYARTSYAPRSSVASTIYGKQAQVLTPAQTGMRAKPTMVSVKSIGNNGSELMAPPVPSIDFQKFGNSRPKSTASAFSVGSTFLNSANTATQARAQVVKVGTLKKVDMGSKAESDTMSSSSTMAPSPPRTPSGNVTRDSSITVIEESPSADQGPFSDPPDRSPLRANKTSLGAVMEDPASENDKLPPTLLRRDSSPFGDKHATKE